VREKERVCVCAEIEEGCVVCERECVCVMKVRVRVSERVNVSV